MSEDKAICFISLISREDQPLYIQTFESPVSDATNDELTGHEDDKLMNNFLKYNFLSHMALDIITSPISPPSDANLLLIQDDVTVYGYESNNGVKIIIGFDNLQPKLPGTVEELFNQVYKMYVKAIINPFFEDLQTSNFDNSIKTIVKNWNDRIVKEEPLN